MWGLAHGADGDQVRGHPAHTAAALSSVAPEAAKLLSPRGDEEAKCGQEAAIGMQDPREAIPPLGDQTLHAGCGVTTDAGDR